MPLSIRPRALMIITAAASAVVLAAGVPASAEPAVGQIVNAGGSTAVPGEYIVVFDDAAVAKSDVSDAARSLAAANGATITYTYDSALRGFGAKVDARGAARMAAAPAVDYVEQSHYVSASGTQPNPPSWGLDRIDQRNLPLNQSYTYPNTASNIHAYVIDTGIRFDHVDFGGRAVSGFDAVDGGTADDCNGHGTHVAGTVGGTSYGVAKSVALVAVRVLNCSGSGTTTGVVAGINWVTSNAIRPAVANMSLGGGASSSIDTAVRNSVSSGITYAVAAGNDGANACNYSPARVAEAITVGATTSTDSRASYSNYGTCLDVFAPGSSIKSAWHTSSTATNTISGTSMASPHVAGAAAMVLSANPGYTPAQVAASIVSTSTTGVVTNPGTGSPNRLLYVGGGSEPPPPPGCSGTNGTNISVPDLGTGSSPISISGCARQASATSTIEVHIVHTYIGDLIVDLVAPDGSVYNLHNRTGGSADNINATYSRNLSSEAASGNWTLRVRDMASQDTGYIDSWTLTV